MSTNDKQKAPPGVAAFGIASTTARLKHEANVRDGKVRVKFATAWDSDGNPTERSIGAMYNDHELVEAPAGDSSARTWFFARRTMEARPGAGGFGRVVVGVSRAPHDGLLYETEIGPLDIDGMLARTES